ncbi:hypothetical protein NDU88_010115 [Pleurodeles waltl]|uniref:Cyclin-dependent kinase inhibitor domain-containing protein n=1 Tax=Pleurodeles waltl TaxID=8319 RepID=A0AAV7PWY8_PLEWA|nr:hypothetical protein NDU88_010115 [Pleurodeles waltl]
MSTSANNIATPLREERPAPISRVGIVPPRGACRSLFGPIDHEELRGELKRQLKEIQARDCQRWNFDFQADTPLRGTYCWEAQESRDVPTFYRETPTEESRKENGSGRASPVAVAKKGSGARAVVPGGKKKQSKSIITDFFPKRKRTSGSKVPGDVCGAHIPLLSIEQTPRKKIR